jgi:hypothetical protein
VGKTILRDCLNNYMQNDGNKLTLKQLNLQGTTVTINSQTILVTERDLAGNVTRCSGAAVPTDAGSGYAIGCKFRLTTANGIGSTDFTNEGSASSCDFNADGVMRMVEVTVSSAEILALNATPKTLVAAPGAEKVLVFHSAVAILDYNSAAYAGIAAGEDLAIRYTDGSGAVASTTLETTGLLDATSDQLRTHKAIVTDLTPVANAALVLHLASGEVTTGNSPMRYKVFYSVISTGL